MKRAPYSESPVLEGVKVPEGLKRVVCPKCGLEFSKLYARATVCFGCPQAVIHCDKVRCPGCDSEFHVDIPKSLKRSQSDFYESIGYSGTG